MPKNHDAPTKSDNNSLVDGDFLRNSIEHDVKKQDVAQERAQDLEHRREERTRKLEQKKLKKDLGRVGVFISNNRRELTSREAVNAELEAWGVKDPDQDIFEIIYDVDKPNKKTQEIIRRYEKFIDFIGESKEFNNKNVEILNKTVDLKEKLKFFSKLGLADQINYFNSSPELADQLGELEKILIHGEVLAVNDQELEAFSEEHSRGLWLSPYDKYMGRVTADHEDVIFDHSGEQMPRSIYLNNMISGEVLSRFMHKTSEYKIYKNVLKHNHAENIDIRATNLISPDSVDYRHFDPENPVSFESGLQDWLDIIDVCTVTRENYIIAHPEMTGDELKNGADLYAETIFTKVIQDISDNKGFFRILRYSGMLNLKLCADYLQLSDIDKEILLSECKKTKIHRSYDDDDDFYHNDIWLPDYNLFSMHNLNRFAENKTKSSNNGNLGNDNDFIHNLDDEVYNKFNETGATITPLCKALELKEAMGESGYKNWINYIPIETIDVAHKAYIEGGSDAVEKILETALDKKFYAECLESDYKNIDPGERWSPIDRNEIDRRSINRLANGVNAEYPNMNGESNVFFESMAKIYMKNHESLVDIGHIDILETTLGLAKSYANSHNYIENPVSGIAAGLEEAISLPGDKIPLSIIIQNIYRDIHNTSLLNTEKLASGDDEEVYDSLRKFYGGSDAYRHKWCFDNSYAHLDGGWSKNSIGKIIYNRLETGVESGIHDATYWLESFQIPEEGYDMAALKLAKKQGNDEINPDDFKMKCIDKQEESDFLAQIMSASPEVRSRLKLPNKEQKIQQLFFNPENAAIYQSLLKLYKNEDISYDDLINQVKQERDEFYSEYINNKSGKSSTWRISKDEFDSKISEVLAKMQETNTNELWTKRVGERMENLYQYGQNREKYIDDATSWLERHSTVANETLTLAFGNRALAIADGEKDSASKLVAWTKLNVIKAISNSKLPENLTKEEVLGKYGNFTKELVRVYPAETTLDALSKYKNIYNPEKIMPANAKKLESGGKEYYGEVLSPEDPRGMTIGVDTGCCMTVDSASSTCIKSGYKDKDAGFFALYDGNKKLMAQSYFYINPEQPEVVVMDNIEACQGRDVEKIVDLYKNYFTEYVKEQFRENPNWQVRQVNIGTGYGEAVKRYVLNLPETEIIKNGHNIYTDADEDQRLLFRLSNEEIEQAKSTRVENTAVDSEKTAKITPNHDFSIYTDSLSEKQAQIIKEIEAQIYPESMRQYGDEDYLFDEITQPNSEKYSFLIKSEQDASHDAAGYCLAYSAESESDPNYDGKTMYVADFGILPDYRSGPAALKGLEEILKRADNNGVGKIEMDAREATSYKLLTSPWTKRFLKRHGWELTDHGDTVEFDDKEKTILISIDRMSEAA